MSSENRWVYLNPDNRKDPPVKGLYCCRCMRPIKETQSFESFTTVEMDSEGIWVRKKMFGKHLIGSKCWDKIKNDFVDDVITEKP